MNQILIWFLAAGAFLMVAQAAVAKPKISGEKPKPEPEPEPEPEPDPKPPVVNPDGTVQLPPMPILTYQYYADGSQVGTPPMSNRLTELMSRWHALRSGHVHVVHAGTKRYPEDAIGPGRDPNSYHLHNPPDAIDITKVYWNDKLIYHPRISIPDRVLMENEFRTVGGKCAHVYDAGYEHIHVQIP